MKRLVITALVLAMSATAGAASAQSAYCGNLWNYIGNHGKTDWMWRTVVMMYSNQCM